MVQDRKAENIKDFIRISNNKNKIYQLSNASSTLDKIFLCRRQFVCITKIQYILFKKKNLKLTGRYIILSI